MGAKSQQGLQGPDISLALAEQLPNNKHNDIVKRRAGSNRGNEGIYWVNISRYTLMVVLWFLCVGINETLCWDFLSADFASYGKAHNVNMALGKIGQGTMT